MGTSPYGCCFKSCLIGSDDFERADVGSCWNVDLGNWGIQSGRIFEAGMPGARAIFQVPHPAGSYRQVVRATTHNEVAGNKYRIHVNNANQRDSSYCVEFEPNTTSYLRIFGPGDNLLREEKVEGATGLSRSIGVCFTEEAIVGSVDNAVIGHIWESEPGPDPQGWYVGLGNGGDQAIYLDDFQYLWHWLDWSDCPKCSCMCWDGGNFKIPRQELTATFRGTGGCSTLNGFQVKLKWNPTDAVWQGENTGCSGFDLRLSCADYPYTCEDWRLGNTSGCISADPDGGAKNANPGCTCDPLHLEFGPFPVPLGDLACGCCGGLTGEPGTYYVEVTEAAGVSSSSSA